MVIFFSQKFLKNKGNCSRRVMKYKPNARGGRKHTRVWLMSSTAAGKEKMIWLVLFDVVFFFDDLFFPPKPFFFWNFLNIGDRIFFLCWFIIFYTFVLHHHSPVLCSAVTVPCFTASLLKTGKCEKAWKVIWWHRWVGGVRHQWQRQWRKYGFHFFFLSHNGCLCRGTC